MIENKMMPQYLHHLYRHITYLILSTFVFSKYHQKPHQTQNRQGFKHEVAPPLMVCLNTGNFWTTTPPKRQTCFRFKRKGLDTFHPKNVQRVCENLGWFPAQKNSRRFAPGPRVCGFAAGHGPGCEKRVQPRFGSRNANKFVPWIRENWREKSKVDSAGCFWFLKDFPVEFIHLWRKFLDAQLNH